MIGSVGARLVTGVILGALWLGTVVAPAAAATHIRWVDNDNNPGDGPAPCNHAKFSTIQDAIDASSPGDKVYVCPGNYQEQLTIDVRNLEVRSMPALGAKIWAPATLTEVDSTTSLVHITARNVLFVGFWLKFNDGDAAPSPPPLSAACSQVHAAILATAPHAVIKANHIKTVGDNTLSGDCGYLFGIVLADPGPFSSGGAWGADTSLVWRNWITDFKVGGILVGGDRSVQVFNNHVRFVHYNDPATCNLVPVLGVNPSLDFPCGTRLHAQNTSPLNGEYPYNFGISVEGSLADLRANTVNSTLDTSIVNVDQLSFLAAGIVMAGAMDGSKVRSNLVDNVFFGIVTSDALDFVPLPVQPTPPAPDGVAVSGNRVSENFIGFFVDASDGYYYANRAHINILGMLVVDGENNVFDHNDFRYNAQYDCDDETTGGTGTLGTWNDWNAVNLGFENNPDGLCMPFFSIP